MSTHLLKRSDAGTVTATTQHRPAFFDPGSLPWLPWVMPGTFFKLLNVNPMNGGFSMLLKVEPDNWAPVHGHLGSVEGWLLEGGFGYGKDDRGRPGHYVFESGGIRHEPDTDKDGMVMFAIAHGPLCGYNDDGSIAGIVDARAMYDLAVAGGAAGHLPKPLDW
ncbi:2,4'-dihydroxyacetophenone dioxygenase family protein [Niveispirillum sp.]|uniref:2,4'-dihydroxyacetophenone dioxygenase family protein n=1 Tax=Niveispirillum sp. TaxID=1917217 RepID=UPI001B721F29|nr:2,4'-dihydroxyacetophenone dioxygenase family protein [Niveispirillum sp.]MBP7334863.1 2,4'-dihydroxyacetophenone dioxygenase family protein [Niveispirillum sp.]